RAVPSLYHRRVSDTGRPTAVSNRARPRRLWHDWPDVRSGGCSAVTRTAREAVMATDPEILEVQCCIAGGGPAGMMLGFLLARAGVEVVVLEKHADFFRDFRGDTVHPSTLELMYELG